MCLRYREMEKGFQHAFAAALRAYRRGSTAIGCAILNAEGECVACGENSIYATDCTEKVNRHHLAHAEINAILKVGTGREYPGKTLYTTMEPCVMCFGAIVMCYYGQVKFAARDPIGGATKLNAAHNYGIAIEGPIAHLEGLQVALTIYRGMALGLSHLPTMLERYGETCKAGVALGRQLYNDAGFDAMINQQLPVTDEVLFDYMLERLPG